jgi:hypothetical protein
MENVNIIEEIVNLVTNNGIGIACVVYMIYFQNTTMKEMLTALTAISERLKAIEIKIDVTEDKEN